MKAGLQVALASWCCLSVLLFMAWAADQGTNGAHYLGDATTWFALLGYHMFLLVLMGLVAIFGWFAEATA